MASLNMTLAGIDNMSLADKKKAHAYLNSSKIAKYMQDYQALKDKLAAQIAAAGG